VRTWRAIGTACGLAAAITRGMLVGPRIVASGPYLEGATFRFPICWWQPAETRAAVDLLAALGVDHQGAQPAHPEVYFAIARRARSAEWSFRARPAGGGALAASDSGPEEHRAPRDSGPLHCRRVARARTALPVQGARAAARQTRRALRTAGAERDWVT
jgi:hypothetical protein